MTQAGDFRLSASVFCHLELHIDILYDHVAILLLSLQLEAKLKSCGNDQEQLSGQRTMLLRERGKFEQEAEVCVVDLYR